MTEADNPANSNDKTVVTDSNRISMALPQLTLEVPAIPGFVMHWFADRPGRIARAINGGYEFVSPDEVRVNNFGLAEDLNNSGNSDLGTRISVHGGTDDKGASQRLYLMKIKKEWYDKDMSLREEASDRVAESLKAGQQSNGRGTVEDAAKRYVRTDHLFTRKQRRPVNG